ncbi:hypothetical protein VRRI112168_00345 [Vreelandella rituensis]|uniref:Uncharacterized protein n=1 Tax=Vreelandella rituensis TaxID=2282306 RepID=A0A368UDI5_9GAMM|nr:hypothetical protein [Halomonas rituensis]RCV93853.1 hypothetical protein DU506_01465 [Halomonas rituensis]
MTDNLILHDFDQLDSTFEISSADESERDIDVLFHEDDFSDGRHVTGEIFSQRDDYRTLMQANLPGSAIYEYGSTFSRRLAYNTPFPDQSSVYSRPRFRYVARGRQPEARFLVSLTENGVREEFLRDHLAHHALEVPYLVAAYHGLLGMAIAGAAIEASAKRDIYERASARVAFPPAGEAPRAMGDHQDVWLPSSSRWQASLCAPVRFNAGAPVTHDDFIPDLTDMVQWRALKDRCRFRDYQSTLPLGVSSSMLGESGALLLKPLNEKAFSASRRHPVVVTMPNGAIIMMCLNTMDGFGEDRLDREKSPLLDWAINKLHRSGGINTVYRHGLQRTVFSLLAEEVYNASVENRRPDVPWVGCGAKALKLPVVLDHEVIAPEVRADDAFRHLMLHNL